MTEENQNNNGQRSYAWFEKRSKKWTGSTNKDLMSEGKLVPKKLSGADYGTAKYKWGGAALTAIFNMFWLRLTDTVEEETAQTWEMQRGEELEPEMKAKFSELYLQFKLVESEDLVDTGFMLNADDDGTREYEDGYKGENGTGGSSVDGCLFENGKLVAVFEGKCRGMKTSNSHAYGKMCSEHKDYAQLQSEMLSLAVDKAYYVHYDDRLISPWNLKVQVVERCEPYIEKIKSRQKDADKIIDGWIKHVGNVDSMMPDERDRKILEVREMCDELSKEW